MDQSIVEAVHLLAKQRNQAFVETSSDQSNGLERSKNVQKRRHVALVHSKASGTITRMHKVDQQTIVDYTVFFEWLYKQQNQLYVEERQEFRRVLFEKGNPITDKEIIIQPLDLDPKAPLPIDQQGEDASSLRTKNRYNRREAVRYAERWWNDYNPTYNKFTDNCTNFISQCLHAGGAPMNRSGQKSKGWWTEGASWSLSWTVAHSLRWYLSGSTSGLRGEEKATAQELQLGDVICYDFTGDGRWQHTTMVVAKDENNEPLVNAQTVNSRMRYWTYEDSTAWTPEIKYKFFRIMVT
ncbi:amidase domain-containing protein [Alkalicoccobacillus murimartini]|uniref:Putative amidase domain-containing protein n=1 Tax=Alkalicoccobacillus murimartini TaxID=171685 RepID=A0ABT9YBN1_9BACI|nr:amidase domain-containing protein [Alkalicoccobacillus murimartini]MDQ0205250.1 hypothetical protein [Alkalicoccobacillus murimartini]